MGPVVVCGAGGALGQAVVSELSLAGEIVIAVGRPGFEQSSIAGGALEGGITRLGADLTDPSAVASLWETIDAIGQPASLVNLVGGFRSGSLADSDPGQLQEMMRLNLDTAWWSCREAASRLSRANAGAIVNVAARAGRVGGDGSTAYAVSKAAVIRLTEVLALELAAHRVRVNSVLPALIDSEANRTSISSETMDRAVAPEAIARVIAFLIGPDGWPISGASIPVFGWA
ncbi:MAG: SDR family NAD(P)-dependent oxidoreductase [Candidatus Dormibacteria bacterium]